MRHVCPALIITSGLLVFAACSTHSVESTHATPDPAGSGGGSAGGGGGDVSSDPLNCGAIGHSCLGGACSAGVCQPFVFASGIDRVTNLAMDPSAIYAAFWRYAQMGSDCSPAPWLSRFDRMTSLQTTLVPCTTFFEYNLYSMTLSGGALFWNHTVDRSTPTGAGRLTRTDVVTGISTTFPDTNGSYTVGVDAQHAYFWDLNMNVLTRSNLDGTDATAIGPTGILVVLVDDTNVYYFTPDSCFNECERDATLVALPKDGSPAITLATGLGGVAIAVLQGGFVYWVDGTEETTDVRRIPVAGGDVQVLAAGNAIESLAVDDQYAYFVDSNANSSTNGVWRVPLGGGPKEAVYRSEEIGLGLAVDDKVLVWSVNTVVGDKNGGEIMMLAK